MVMFGEGGGARKKGVRGGCWKEEGKTQGAGGWVGGWGHYHSDSKSEGRGGQLT